MFVMRSIKGVTRRLLFNRFILFSFFVITNVFVILPWIFHIFVPNSRFDIIPKFMANEDITKSRAMIETTFLENFTDKATEHFPVDIVYTWVNGSDPIFIKDMERYLYPYKSHNCEEENCFLSPYYYIRKNGYTIAEGDIVASLHPKVVSNSSDTFWIFSLESYTNKYKIARLLEKGNYSFSPYNQMYWTTDSADGRHLKVDNSYLIRLNGHKLSEKCLLQLLGNDYQRLIENCDFQFSQDKCVAECSSPIENIITQAKTHFIVLPAYLSPLDITKGGMVGSYHLNRYSDNNELLYSLRSVERYIPWVRNVFILTNGQIPSWLNLDNPRVKVVAHDEIFLDPNDLPSFSSVAIEDSMYRIPGLSEHYLYFNDDQFIDAPVYMNDFYTKEDGYTIYHSFEVFPCNEQCTFDLLTNQKCDQKCNTELCSYDGGYCVNSAKNMEPKKDNFQSLCAPTCHDALLGNSECDQECNTSECGFDCGDCGVEKILQDLPEIKLPMLKETIYVPEGYLAAWFDLSQYESETIGVNYPLPDKIKAISVIAERKLAVVIFQPNFRKEIILFNLYNRRNKRSRISFILESASNITGNDDCTTMLNLKEPPEPTNPYVSAVKHVNKLFNEKYGFHRRGVQSHLPHFMNKNIFEDLHNTWPLEFAKTSSSKFRTVTDMMSVTFAYFNFLMSESVGHTAAEVFDTFDIDKSGSWSEDEIVKFLERFYNTSTNESLDFLKDVEHCCQMNTSADALSELPWQKMLDCPNLTAKLTNVENKSRHKFKILQGKPYSYFTVLMSDKRHAEKELKTIQTNKKKFVCISLAMTNGKADNKAVFQLLRDYYQKEFPNPSSFEINHTAN